MPAYLCRWMNGDVSIVMAADPEDAVIRLDEFGNADHAELYEIEDLMIDFRLEDDGRLRIQQWGDLTIETLMEKAFPHLNTAIRESLDGGEEVREGVSSERIRAVVELERTRLLSDEEEEGPQARTEVGREVQQTMGAPAALIDRLSEQVGKKILEETDLDEPEH